MTHPHQDELLDLVDDNDQVIGTMMRSEVRAKGLRNFRAVNMMIINDEGKLWVPRRVATKKSCPSALDMSVGGHVESGEDYDQTLRREAQEELNLNVDDFEIRTLGMLTPHEDGAHCFSQTYEMRSNNVPNYNRDDFQDSYWLTPQEIIDKLAAGDTSKGDLPILIKKYYL